MAYKDDIFSLWDISFNSIRDVAKKYINSLSDDERNEIYESLNHGIDLLDTDAQMKCYLYSFGKMHQAKMYKALSCLNMNIFTSENIDIVDWGCGNRSHRVGFKKS